MAGSWNGLTFNGDDTNDVAQGGDGDERIWGNKGDDNLKGGKGKDYIDGGVGSDDIDGGEGDDVLTDVQDIPWGFSGLIGHDTLRGGKGNDELRFYSPDTGDIADGGDGIDLLRIDYTAIISNNIFFTLGPTTNVKVDEALTVSINNIERVIFRSGGGNDVLTGGALDDSIFGAGGNDTLKGMGGNDYLDGGTGIQDIDGGSGTDSASFNISGATNAIILTNSASVSLGAYGQIKNVESFDTIVLGSGNNTVKLTQTSGISLTTYAGNDTITTVGAADIMSGSGNDVIHTGASADFVNPGDGNDTVYLGDGDDELNYNDWSSGINNRKSPDADKIYGEGGNDKIYAAAGGDTIDGGSGNDTIYAGDGADTVKGGDGDDNLNGDGGADIIYGGDGNDRISTDGDSNTGDPTFDNDTQYGGNGNDYLVGGLGLDKLYGEAGDDTLSVGVQSNGTIDAQVDQFDGGSGIDTLELFPFSFYSTGTVDVTLAATTNVKINDAVVAVAKNMERLAISAYGSGNHKITGGDYADTIYTGQGNDTIHTGGGDDLVNADNGNDIVDTGDGNDTVYMSVAGKDKATLGAGNDTLIMTAYSPNTFYSAPVGAGTYDGGSGIDTLNLNFGYTSLTDLKFDGSKLTSAGKLLGTFTGFEAITFSGPGAFSFTGGTGNDTVTGSALNDTLSGKGGNDTINAGTGDDTLDGGDGNDQLYAGAGKDKVLGGAGDDTITAIADVESDTIDGGSGIDKVTLTLAQPLVGQPVVISGSLATGAMVKSGATVVATLKSIEALSIFTGDGDDTLIGGSGGDTLNAGGGKNSVKSGAGDDSISIVLDAKADSIDGGSGADRLNAYTTAGLPVVVSGNFATSATIKIGGTVAATITGIESVSLSGSEGNDVLLGAAGNDNLNAGAGSDTLKGLAGNDTLSVDMSDGKDTLDGGTEDDIANLYADYDATVGITMALNGAVMEVKQGADLRASIINVEKFNVNGTLAVDLIIGGGGDDTLYGYAGNDKLRGYAGNDKLYGGLGTDTLDGGTGRDMAIYSDLWNSSISVTLVNGAGTVSVDGASSDKLISIEDIWGAGGADTITGDVNDNTILGGGGNDTLNGGGGVDTVDYSDHFVGVVLTLSGATVKSVTSGTETDQISNFENARGGYGADTLTGDIMANTLWGGGGIDTLAGAGGDDVLDGGAGGDTLNGGSGVDTASYATATAGVVASLAQPSANTGDAQGDSYVSIENLAGSAYDDTLTGNSAANVLGGGAGNDLLVGGSGKDTFVFDSKLGPTNIDTIDDFIASDDTIFLAADIFTKAGAVGDLSSVAFYAGTKAHDGDDRIIYDKVTGKLWYDADGTGATVAVQFALLDKGLTLTAADFDIIA